MNSYAARAASSGLAIAVAVQATYLLAVHGHQPPAGALLLLGTIKNDLYVGTLTACLIVLADGVLDRSRWKRVAGALGAVAVLSLQALNTPDLLLVEFGTHWLHDGAEVVSDQRAKFLTTVVFAALLVAHFGEPLRSRQITRAEPRPGGRDGESGDTSDAA